MKYLKRYVDMINELKVHNILDDNYDTFIYCKGDLFVFEESDWSKISEEILESLSTKGVSTKWVDTDYFNYYEFEEILDLIVGGIEDNYLHIQGGDYRNSTDSADIKKILKELNLKGVKVINTEPETGEEDHFTDEEGKYYHGTCLKFLNNIYKKGIQPNDISNFGDIKTKGMVFFTSNYEKAVWHSKKAASVNNSYPCVIELRVPDKSKMIVDFDLANAYYSDDSKIKDIGYEPNKNRYRNNYDTKRDISNKIGVFGYKGRIPSNHIDKAIIDIDSYEENIWDYHPDYGAFEREDFFSDIDPSSEWDEMDIKSAVDRINEIEDDYLNEEEE